MSNMLNRANLQPHLVHLIAGLRLHQVQEAVALLLDYIDASKALEAEPSSPAELRWQASYLGSWDTAMWRDDFRRLMQDQDTKTEEGLRTLAMLLHLSGALAKTLGDSK